MGEDVSHNLSTSCVVTNALLKNWGCESLRDRHGTRDKGREEGRRTGEERCSERWNTLKTATEFILLSMI